MTIENSKAYLEGYKAFEDGLSEDDNPYEEGTNEAEDWDDGYNQADYES